MRSCAARSAPVSAEHPDQRLSDPLRDDPGRDLRHRTQQQHEPVDRPRRPELSASLATRSLRHRQPGTDQGAARRAVEGDHRTLQDPGHRRRRGDPGAGAAAIGRCPGDPGGSRSARRSSPSTATSRACGRPPVRRRPRAGQPAAGGGLRPAALNASFDEYFTTVAEYNRAEFELFHAMGYPARELAQLRPPARCAGGYLTTPYLPPLATDRAGNSLKPRGADTKDQSNFVPGDKGASPMHRRSDAKYFPSLERLEAKQLLSAGPRRPPSRARRLWRPTGAIHQPAPPKRGAALQPKPNVGYLVYRITNPNRHNKTLMPPSAQVLVQSQQPIPGQIYNVLYVVVRNGTAKTFDASSGSGSGFLNRANPSRFDRERAMEVWTTIRLLYTH